MISDIVAIQYISLAFGGVLALIWIISEAFYKPAKKSKRKNIFLYTCILFCARLTSHNLAAVKVHGDGAKL